jgi:hypothetical protein
MSCLSVRDDEDVDRTLSLLSVSPREIQRKVVYQLLLRLPEDLAVSQEYQRCSGRGDEDMATTRDILLVGSMRLTSAEDVFRTVASLLGDKVRRIPDGETGIARSV